MWRCGDVKLLVTAHLLLNIQAHGVGGALAEDGRLSTVSTLQLDTVSTQLQLVMVTQAMCPAYVCQPGARLHSHSAILRQVLCGSAATLDTRQLESWSHTDSHWLPSSWPALPPLLVLIRTLVCHQGWRKLLQSRGGGMQ